MIKIISRATVAPWMTEFLAFYLGPPSITPRCPSQSSVMVNQDEQPPHALRILIVT